MAQLLVHLPDELLARLKRVVRPRSRSRFVQNLLEKALPPEDDDPLYRSALEVEQDEALNAEMAEWDATVGDGLDNWAPWEPSPPKESRCSVSDLAKRLGKDPKRVRQVLREMEVTRTGREYELTPDDCRRVIDRFRKKN